VGFGQKTHSLYVVGVMNVSRKQILDNLFETFEPIIENMGLELLDVEFTSEEGRTILRVTIYEPDGVTLDDCVAVDRTVGPILDELDPIPGSYNLEVSSPGLERRLKRDKEYQIFSGRLCRVNLYGPVNGKRTFEGILLGLGDSSGEQTVVIRAENEEIALPRAMVSKVQLVYREKPF